MALRLYSAGDAPCRGEDLARSPGGTIGDGCPGHERFLSLIAPAPIIGGRPPSSLSSASTHCIGCARPSAQIWMDAVVHDVAGDDEPHRRHVQARRTDSVRVPCRWGSRPVLPARSVLFPGTPGCSFIRNLAPESTGARTRRGFGPHLPHQRFIRSFRLVRAGQRIRGHGHRCGWRNRLPQR